MALFYRERAAMSGRMRQAGVARHAEFCNPQLQSAAEHNDRQQVEQGPDDLLIDRVSRFAGAQADVGPPDVPNQGDRRIPRNPLCETGRTGYVRSYYKKANFQGGFV